jgi:hydrogenase maturation protease
MRIYVVGIGNAWASDDGLGPEIVRRLQAEYRMDEQGYGAIRPAPAVTFVVLPQAGVELIDLMERCEVLILVDAMAGGLPPGAVYREEWQPGLLASRGMEWASSHGLGLREVLNLAATLGKLPSRVILWGLEIASTTSGHGLSAPVASAVPGIVEQLKRELETICTLAVL